jgi:hypothetical protein
MTGCFGRKASGRMFGGIKLNKNWRKQHNKKLMHVF